MIQLFTFVLASYGIAWFLVYSEIADPAISWLSDKSDFLQELFSCIICTSFWCGVFLSHFYLSTNFFYSLINGFVALGFTALVNEIGNK